MSDDQISIVDQDVTELREKARTSEEIGGIPLRTIGRARASRRLGEHAGPDEFTSEHTYLDLSQDARYPVANPTRGESPTTRRERDLSGQCVCLWDGGEVRTRIEDELHGLISHPSHHVDGEFWPRRINRRSDDSPLDEVNFPFHELLTPQDHCAAMLQS